MIFRHKRTGKDYRVLLESFDTERQEHHTVYLQIETGLIFNRSSEIFEENFQIIDALPQASIQPNDPKRKLER